MVIKKSLPLIYAEEWAQDIAYWNKKNISRQLFLQHVETLSKRLPDQQYPINLCHDRYHFMVAFAATIIRNQVNLLPLNQTAGEVTKLCSEYTDSYILSDQPYPGSSHFQFDVTTFMATDSQVEIPYVSEDQLVAMVFTSGSTGQAKANMKYWGSLSAGTELLAKRFGFQKDAPKSVVATVVPQHMFGLETSVLLPMLTNTLIHSEKPFYPADICNAMSELKSARVLVTTPVHLKACVNTDIKWPNFEFVLSATAPLSKDIACAAQQRMGSEVREIFGCTEAGSFASRILLKNTSWELYDTFRLAKKNGVPLLSAPHLTEDIVLSDIIEEHKDGSFSVIGRNSDMLKIAGKRVSLADLNHKLNRIENVQDGVFFVPDEIPGEDKILRLCAFVVAEKITEAEILARLCEVIDSVFLPRPLIKLNQLPYNSIGKLPRKALTELYVKHSKKGGSVLLNKEFTINSEHPSLAGHFPDHPLVPGVVILDEILSAIHLYDSRAVLESVTHLKFLAPLKADKVCQLTMNLNDYAKVLIECRLAGRVIVKGKLVLSRQEDAT